MSLIPTRDGRKHRLRKPPRLKPKERRGPYAPLNDPMSERAFGVCGNGHPQCRCCDYQWDGFHSYRPQWHGAAKPSLPWRWRR